MNRIDLRQRHELGDLDGVRGAHLHRLELFRRKQHVLILGELVAFDQLVAGHQLIVGRAVELVLDAGAALLVDEVERHFGAALGGRIQLYGYGHQPEGDGSRRNRSRRHDFVSVESLPPTRQIWGCGTAGCRKKPATGAGLRGRPGTAPEYSIGLSISARDRSANTRLGKYHDKRTAERTPEPFGYDAEHRPRLFVVQQHAATRLHYDLRLEHDGVLLSWAVPQGFSRDPAVKRLAVHTEDHPIEYADFEGVIPEGNYGAGAMIVWDRGAFVPVEDIAAGLEKGKLLVELRGYKLRGEWALVRTKPSVRQRSSSLGAETKSDWLLIKHEDAYSRPEAEGKQDAYDARSVLSGLTVHELAEGTDRAVALRQQLQEWGAPDTPVAGTEVDLTLAKVADSPFSRPGWIFELKYDGYRLLAEKREGRARLFYRSGIDATDVFPEVARAVQALPYEQVVLDGEVTVADDQGKPSFGRLQKRGRLSRMPDIAAASVQLPAVLFCFDLVGFEGFDLRRLPLLQRKEVLQKVVPPAGSLRYADHVEEKGEALYEQIVKMGLEGLVAKRAAAPYPGRRSESWLKIRAERLDDMVIVGFTAPQGMREGFGALHMAAYDGDRLVYLGRVGSGFSDRQLDDIGAGLEELVRDEPPAMEGPLPEGNDNTWVEPRLAA